MEHVYKKTLVNFILFYFLSFLAWVSIGIYIVFFFFLARVQSHGISIDKISRRMTRYSLHKVTPKVSNTYCAGAIE